MSGTTVSHLPPASRPCRRHDTRRRSQRRSIPAVRAQCRGECRFNPLTVLKAYQQLVDEQFVETKRGLGMFVKAGARNLLLKGEREKFLAQHWPRVAATFSGLASHQKELLAAAKRRSSSKTAKEER